MAESANPGINRITSHEKPPNYGCCGPVVYHLVASEKPLANFAFPKQRAENLLAYLSTFTEPISFYPIQLVTNLVRQPIAWSG
jgi:hypothetical protein